MNQGRITSLNISTQKGTQKHPIPKVEIDLQGIVGDAHHGFNHRMISLLALEEVHRFALQLGRELQHGEFAENITTQGIDFGQIHLLDEFHIGSSVRLQITQRGKECHNQGCSIFQEVGECLMPKQGLFATVLTSGSVQIGDPIIHVPKVTQIDIITLSDRAFRGEYMDRSGPLIKEVLTKYWEHRGKSVEIKNILLPDDPQLLKQQLQSSLDRRVDFLFTTGGTGVGPRDMTPDVVSLYCEKLIPGIMESIRLKYGQENPKALLSRAIAGVRGKTVLYTLPGSERAVTEYLSEILKTAEHLMLMLHGLGH